MSEMVDRIGRQLAAQHYAKRFGKPVDDPHVQMNVDANWQMFEENIRTIIEAMREPTSKMTLAGFDQLDCEHTPHAIENAWAAMITAALSSEKE